MRTLNVRLFIILCVGTLVAAGLTHWLHGFQVQRNASIFLQEGNKAKEEKKLGEAIRHFKRYVSMVPGDIDALADLGLLYADVSANRRAFFTLEKVVRLQPERDDIRTRLVEIAMKLGRVSDARIHLEDHLLTSYLERVGSKDNDEVPEVSETESQFLNLLAQCQMSSGELDEAKRSLEHAILGAPDQLDTYVRLAMMLRFVAEQPDTAGDERENPENAAFRRESKHPAGVVMAEMVASNSKSARAFVLRGAYYRRLGITREPLEDANSAITLASDDREALILAAECLADVSLQAAREGKRDDADEKLTLAREHLRHGLSLDPRDLAMHVATADIEARTGHRDKAMESLRNGLEVLPGQPNLLWSLAHLLIEQGEFAEADEKIEQLRTASYSAAQLQYLQARILFGKQQWFEASKELETLRTALADQPNMIQQVEFWLAQCYRKLGDIDAQLAALRNAVDIDATWLAPRLQLAEVLQSMGRIGSALDEYRQLTSVKNAPVIAWVRRAQLLVMQNKLKPDEERSWRQVDNLLTQVRTRAPENIPLLLIQAEVELAKNETDGFKAAETLLLGAQQQHPEQIEPRIALIVLAQRKKDWEHAEQLLDETEKELGDSVPLRLTRAAFLVRRPQTDKPKLSMTLAENVEELSEAEQTVLFTRLAAIALQLGQLKEAHDLCERAVQQDPNSLNLQLLWFEVAQREGNHAVIDERLEEIRRIAGEGAYWRFGNAARFYALARESVVSRISEANEEQPKESRALTPAESELLTKARTQLEEAEGHRRNWSRVPLLAARIYELEDDEEGAIQNYRRAIELGETDPHAVEYVVRLLYERDQYEEADQVIRHIEQETTMPLSSMTERRASRASSEVRDFSRALRLAKNVAEDSELPEDHIWLGQVYGLLDDNAEAEKSLNHAIALDDTNPRAWVALIQFYRNENEPDKEQAAIKQAEEKISFDGSPLQTAQWHEAIGQNTKAVSSFLTALAVSPDDVSTLRSSANFFLTRLLPLRAEPQLRRLIDPELGAQAKHVKWARRNLALVVANQGGFQRYEEAMELIKQNLQDAPDSAADRRVKAIVMARQGKRRVRREAIDILEELLAARKLPQAIDHFLLAQLYQAEGDSSAAVDRLQDLLAADRNDIHYMAAYISVLLERNEFGDAEIWINRLASQRRDANVPDDVPFIALKARTLSARNKHSEAIRAYRLFIDGLDDEMDTTAANIRLVAVSLENLATQAKRSGDEQPAKMYADEANLLYRKYADLRPDGVLTLASFLGRQGQVDDGLELAQQAWSSLPATRVAATCVGLLLLSGTVENSGQIEGVEGSLRVAIDSERNPGARASLQIAMAELRNMQGRFDEATALYQGMLSENGDHVVALNNYAYLLAMRGTRTDDSLQMMNRAIELAGPQSELLDTRASVYLALKDPENALADINEAIEDSPTALRYFHLAQCQQMSRNRTEAVKSMQKANELGLTVEKVHPLERDAYVRLTVSLQQFSPGDRRTSARR